MKTKTYGISFFSHIRVLLPGMNYLENSDNHTKDLSESLSNTLFLLFIVFPYFIFSAHINVLYVTSVIMHLCDMFILLHYVLLYTFITVATAYACVAVWVFTKCYGIFQMIFLTVY